MAILKDRGLFWWNDKSLDKNQFAARNSSPGELTIEDNGAIRLDVDAGMPDRKHPFASLDSRGKPGRSNIQGLLNGDAGYVLLTQVVHNGGGFRSRNVSPDGFIASRCLVSKTPFRRDDKRALSFRAVHVDLAGFEEWLWLRSIKINRRRTRLTAQYKKERDLENRVPFGKLVIAYDLLGPHFGETRRDDLTLTELVTFKIRPRRRLSLDECLTYHQRAEEFIILLTDYERSLDWPVLVGADGKQRATLYFRRYRSENKAPGANECLTNFRRIAPAFGELFARFIEKREEFGPGFYLYLGTRRGIAMFVEHRFINYIWGLEAFHRRGKASAEAPSRLAEKIARILSAVQDNDRRWLKHQLRHAAEPALEDRLFKLFSALPLPFNDDGLREFCIACAKLRNDISHFGVTREEGQPYDEFMRELDTKSDALAALYHLHLLTVIGIDQEMLSFETNGGSWPLSHMEIAMRAVGLLKPKEEPKPIEVPQTAPGEVVGIIKGP